jgi:hypothetical protein
MRKAGSNSARVGSNGGEIKHYQYRKVPTGMESDIRKLHMQMKVTEIPRTLEADAWFLVAV